MTYRRFRQEIGEASRTALDTSCTSGTRVDQDLGLRPSWTAEQAGGSGLRTEVGVKSGWREAPVVLLIVALSLQNVTLIVAKIMSSQTLPRGSQDFTMVFSAGIF